MRRALVRASDSRRRPGGLASLVATLLIIGQWSALPLAQSAVTAADVQRLRHDSFEAGTELARLRTGDAVLLERLRAELDEARTSIDTLDERLTKGHSVSRADYVTLRDRIERIRRTARSEITVTGAGLGPAAAAPDPSTVAPVGLSIPSGTRVDIRLLGSLDPASVRVDDRIEATTAKDLVVSGRVAVPAGSLMRGLVKRSEAASTSAGAVLVRFDAITVGYRTHRITATTRHEVRRPLAAGARLTVRFD